MKKLLYIYIIGFTILTFSQKREQDSLPKNIDDYVFVNPGDTLTINLKGISILPKHKFNSKDDVRYYLWFRRKVFKAYPYAQLASERLDSLKSRLHKIKKRSKRQKYTKRIQKYIEGEFSDQIKKMTTTEGRILIKLIHRQTGQSAFNNIKELRSGWRAFWYNTTANVFKLSLKTEYHPEAVNEDFLIEDVLQRAFMDGALKEQETKLNFDFQKITLDKKSKIDIEEYRQMFAKLKKKKKRKKIKSKK
ncbi:DUF4294 domain-containing protein [uncultured Polaribacter sp.]|uniref:DUF4294 domain-containing protein n=1 Tax=uncultured Polaribacter sp. TaxID=174711 RepID=UPI002633D680|nr:DUF4294 domain-containing protein [uncultured Polaribacter sp.]